jgi:hypothetical protein
MPHNIYCILCSVKEKIKTIGSNFFPTPKAATDYLLAEQATLFQIMGLTTLYADVVL